MKRDNDLLRELLFEFEGSERVYLVFPDYAQKDETYAFRHYHVQLLCDKGFLSREGKSGYRLTSAGHDFIEAIRDNGIWQKTKDTVAQNGGSATLDIIKQIATAFLVKQIKERTGLDL